MARKIPAVLAALALVGQPLAAQTASIPAAPPAAPKLLIVISVDQFSADLFAEYRQHYSMGMKRLAGGVVFPSGYQSHNMTETCPGHATILTGSRPSRTGMIGNEWMDLTLTRPDKIVYCVEDERVPGTSSTGYTVSPVHLKVPTLGERMKAANPAARVVSVAGKDRSAVMMGGHAPDSIWWWEGNSGFTSYAGKADPAVAQVNGAVARLIGQARPRMDVPTFCAAKNWPVDIGVGQTVGTGRFARAAGDLGAFRTSPELDAATLVLAAMLIETMKLGRQARPDIISIGLSAGDYIGHADGPGGLEMCIQQAALDQALGDFFARIDAQGLDYLVVLTADHGGHDLPERQRMNGIAGETRVDPLLEPEALDKALAAETGIAGPVIHGVQAFGDFWLARTLTPAQRTRVQNAAVAKLAAHPQVAAVFTSAELAATPSPTGRPDSWSLRQQVRAGFDPLRSGDIFMVLNPWVTPIVDPTPGYTSTHASGGNNNRRVPILFWRKGLTPFEQPASVETVDIMPTLARLIGLAVPAGEIDGRCLDIYAGLPDSCR